MQMVGSMKRRRKIAIESEDFAVIKQFGSSQKIIDCLA